MIPIFNLEMWPLTLIWVKILIKAFFSPDSQFRVLSGLVCLLESELLSPPSRLAAYAVLSESKLEPFVNAVRQIEKSTKNSEEQVKHITTTWIL